MYASRSDRELILNIIESDFGQTAKLIAQGILRSDGLKLPGIIEYVQRTVKPTQISMSEIKCSLLKLLQHNMLTFKPVAPTTNKKKSEQMSHTTSNACYYIDISEVLYRLHFPRFIDLAKKKFGDAGEIIMEEILVNGRVRMDESIELMSYRLAESRLKKENSEDASSISERELQDSRELVNFNFVEMAKNRYISRVHPVKMTLEQQKSKSIDLMAEEQSGNKNQRGANNMIKSEISTESLADEHGIAVRVKKEKKNVRGSNLPVELMMLLESQDMAMVESDEAEFVGTVNPPAKKRSRLSKRAKLPKHGATPYHTQTKADNQSNSEIDEKTPIWRCGTDQLLRELRHDACVRFAMENVNHVAGVIVSAMLSHSMSHERESNEPTSHPMSAREIYKVDEVKQALPKEIKDTWRLLLNYLAVMVRDKSGMVTRVGAEKADSATTQGGDGGQYVVHMKNITDFLKQATMHAYIQDKFGVQSARIVRLILEKRQLEQKSIGELALLPLNESRRRVYDLYSDKFIHLQEIPKRSDHNPVHTMYTWSVNTFHIERVIRERVQDSICKLRSRRDFIANDNKELIARSNQLVEENDLEKFDKLSRSLDRLDRSLLQLDENLMLYRDF
uniref:DNA-directed RNA polymerase III subunit RPC3 n=1 Tax=Albugo laibachii Nc14 TaxID=890382 RepID=F0W543_9STRA|nr:PREDICTED: similar to Polymerase (RNA) III (DNA directed) polypeptide C (62kD) putative [Albugo laibachii Nc14]|eukprot:CCA16234.1 PREDICTED: similar to Polymerase (RNA) III (DNA directed) polypeptide C (62kD) putative [Albugo laibachii Nc14]